MFKISSKITAGLAILFFSGSVILGQTTFGSLIGTVTDPSGAVIPGVQVTLTNLGTGGRQVTVSNAQGIYQFVNLTPGSYKVEAEKPGFKRLSRQPVVIQVHQAYRIDLTMSVGSVKQTVQVTAATPLLQPETSSLGQVIAGRSVEEMPLNGRNVFNLMALVPSVVPQGGAIGTPTGENSSAWGNYQIGGAFANQGAIYLDGAPLNNGFANQVSLVPTQDSIQEFKVQTNNLGAEWGRFAGGVMNLTTKSGTNQIHGEAYEYLRNTALNSSNFFSNQGGIAKPPFHQNQFGANAGGPLVIPHLYNGHDKTFWFVSYEGFRLREGETFTETVPTTAERGGDFSAAGTVIYNPLTVCGEYGNAPCAVGANGQPVYTRQPFAGNVIPSTSLNPTSAALLRLWPLPNQAGLVNNYTSDTDAGGNNSEVVARIGQNISVKQRIFGRFSYWNNLVLPVDPLHTGVCVDSCTDKFNVYNFVIDDSYTFSPTTLGDFHASVDRFDYNRSPLQTGIDLTTIGWPASYNTAIPPAVRTVPTPTVTGYADGVFGTGGLGSAIIGRENDYDADASITKIAGRHSLNFGGDFRVIQHNYGQTNNASGAFTFDSGFTSSAPFSLGTGGNAFASYLLGYPSSGGNTIPAFVAAQQTYRAVWAQDSWKVTNKLTLNLGLHYEIDGPWSERFNRLSFWDLNAPFPLANQVGMPNLKGTLGLVATTERPSRNPVNFDYKQFAPRVGFAYMLTPKTVVRGGYGIFWIPPNLELESSPDHDILNAISTSFISSINGGVTPYSNFSNPFPNGILEPPGHNPSFLPTLYGQGPVESYPNNPYGYLQQWNIDLQRELPAGLFADLAYAGSEGVHLPGFAESVDALPDQYLSMGQALEASVANPFASVFPATSPLATSTVTASQLLRPYPQWSDVWLASEGYGTSSYSSFQAKLQKNFKAGGTLLVAYTNSKLMSVGVSTLTPWLEANGGPSGVVDWNNREESRALASYDVPQRLVISYVLNLPVGYGRKYASGMTGLAGKLVSGWGVDGITTFQRGFPLQLGTSLGLVGPYDSAATPNRLCSNPALGGSAESRLNKWFNTACFAQPAPFTYGNEAPDDPTLREQGINNFDFALFKNTSFGPGEKLGLQFRAEFFNLFNTPQFGPANTTCCSNPSSPAYNPNFGVVSSQINNSRLIQFALKFLF